MRPLHLTGIIIFLLSISTVCGQVSTQDTTEPEFFLRKELAFRFYAHTSGFGFGVTKAYHQTVFRKRIMEAEILNMKAAKEIRTIYPYADNSKSYVYGKLNYLFIIRGGYGFEKLLNRKPYWGGVEVRYLYHVGASIGFEKPVYLYIINYPPNSDKYSLTTEKYDPKTHFYDNIYGRAPFTYGLKEIKLHPGVYGKFGFQFDFGSESDRIKALETGVVLDAYPEGVKIMAFNKPDNLFLTFYLSLNLGKRYNRNPELLGERDNEKK